jgi:hypothetical protein
VIIRFSRRAVLHGVSYLCSSEWIGFIWLKIRISGGLFEHGKEPSGFMKDGGFLD